MSQYEELYQSLLEMTNEVKERLEQAYVLDKVAQSPAKGKLAKAQQSTSKLLMAKIQKSLKQIRLSLKLQFKADEQLSEEQESAARGIVSSNVQYSLEFKRLVGVGGLSSLAKKKSSEGVTSFRSFLNGSVHTLGQLEEVRESMGTELDSTLTDILQERFAILANGVNEDRIRLEQMVRNAAGSLMPPGSVESSKTTTGSQTSSEFDE